MFENLDAWTIVSVVLGIVATFFGVYLLRAKLELGKVVNLLKQVTEYGEAHVAALADDKYTDDEKVILKKEWNDVVDAVKAIFPKLFEKKVD